MDRSFRSISLRQVVEADLPFLFRLFTDPDRCHLWMHGRRVYDEAGFQHAWSAWAEETMAAKFLVERAGRPVGLVFDHERTPEDGHTQVTALLEEGSTGHGGGVLAAALLVDWLFRTQPLRKIYLKVYGYNPAVVGMLRKLGAAEEGVLRQDRYFNGAYWDLHVFAVYRDGWPALCARLLRRQPQGEAAPRSSHPGQEEAAASLRGRRNGCLSGVVSASRVPFFKGESDVPRTASEQEGR
jgi:RimJ/RimL family protein N-acetyltransferase